MSTLEIRKLQSGAFKHVDSIDGEFFLGRFSFKNEFNIAFLVEAYGAKRRTYSIGDIAVYNYLGTVENFTNFTDLINRLVALNYTGIDTNNIINGFLSDDPTTYTSATLPLTGTEVAILNDGVNWVKITWNNIISSLSSVFQTILVSGTNIKTINGTSILGSGNLVVGGGGGGSSEDILQSSWQDSIFNTDNSVVGSLKGYNINGGNINQAISSPNIAGFMNFLPFCSGTSANGGYRYITLGNGLLSAIRPQSGLTAFGCICIYANSSADSYTQIGFSNNFSLTSFAYFGIYLEITGANAVFKTTSSNASSTTAIAVLDYSASLGSEIPYYFMMTFISDTEVLFKMIKYDGTVMINQSLNTNVPATSQRLNFAAMSIIQTAGSDRKIIGLSRVGFGVKKPSFLDSF